MKTQMRFQKILMFVSLVVAALTFVYALYFLTGSMGNVSYYITVRGTSSTDKINGQHFLDASQGYVGTAVTLSIIFIVIAVLLFVASCHKRRNYYITNYIAVGIFVGFALVMAIYLLVMVTDVMNIFYTEIDWDKLADPEVALALHPVTKDATNFILGYILSVIVIVDAVLVILSTVWKFLLIRGEKKLLNGEPVKEAA